MKLTLEQLNKIETNQLTAQELMILRLTMVNDKKPAYIGGLLAISRQRVETVLASADRKLKAQGVK
jgi:predicted DNA-binding protein (UPF0251 family)